MSTATDKKSKASSSSPALQAKRATLHIVKKELGISDDIYRDILREATGRESSAEMNLAMMDQVLERFKELGWVPRAVTKNGKRGRPLAGDAESKLIRALWKELHRYHLAGAVKEGVRNPAEAALCAFVKRQTRCDALQWLRDREAVKVIEALKEWRDRAKIECFNEWFKSAYPDVAFPAGQLGALIRSAAYSRVCIVDPVVPEWLGILGDGGFALMVEYVAHCRERVEGK